MTTNQPNLSDYPYLRQKLAEEEARRHGRHDSAATIKAAVSSHHGPPPPHSTLPLHRACSYICVMYALLMRDMFQHIEDVRTQAVMPAPSKENDWLGFCASAIKLQNGDKKVRHADAHPMCWSPRAMY